MYSNEILKILKLYGKVEVGSVRYPPDKYRVRLIDNNDAIFAWDESADLYEAAEGVLIGIEGTMICAVRDIEEGG